ncbi:MAG: hypothetical protein AB4062_19895 [Crocosphaera sp.]
MKPHNHQNINPQPSQPSDPQFEAPIDAEIIAEIEVYQDHLEETEETVINLTPYPAMEDYEEHHQSLDPLPQGLKHTLISLSSPWGLGSLCLVISANLSIVGVQLWTIHQTPEPELSTKINPAPSSLSLSIPKSLNIARQSPNKVVLDALSTVSIPEPSQPAPQNLVKAAPPPQTPTQTVVHINKPPSLTNAILPPSLQPQIPRNAPSPSLPVANIPRSVPSMTIAPPPPPPRVSLEQQNSQTEQNPKANPMALPTINPDSLSQDEQIRQTIQKQLQMKDNNQSGSPLGFNHKTRLQLQHRQNQLPPESLPEQIKHLQQLQQQEVLLPQQ